MPGGAAKVAGRLAESQRNAGHCSSLVVGHKLGSSDHTSLFPFEAVKDLRALCGQSGLLYYEFQGSHKLINNPVVQSADILHLHNLHDDYFNPFSIPALARLKPIVWTLHDMQSFTGHCAHSFSCEKWKTGCGECPDLEVYPEIRTDTTARLWKDKELIYNHSSLQLVAPSQWLKAKVEQSVLRNFNVELIYNGVDTTIFRPFDKKEARRKFGIPENRLIIGAVASGSALGNVWKGGVFTIEALKGLWQIEPNAIFVNVGSDCRIDDPRILSIPNIDNETELAQAYSTLDIFLYTSLADNCPLVVLEALSCGLPIVAFKTGGVPELVRNGVDGFVTDYKDAEKAGQSLCKLAKDKELRLEFGRNAREIACAKFDHKLITEQYERLYYRRLDEFNGSHKIAKRINLFDIPDVIKTEPFIRAEYSGPTKALGTIVTAIVSTYNSEQFIRGCLEDLEAQTMAKDLEIVVIDSGSPQNEKAIVEEFQRQYHNIKYIRTERETVYAAWNRGVKAASGRYITNANTDDRHRNDAYEIMANMLDKNPDISLVYADVYQTRGENETFANHTAFGKYKWHDFDRKILLDGKCYIGPQPMWRKAVHDEYGYFHDAYVSSGDYEFWLRISQTNKLFHIKETLGLYLESPGSLEHLNLERQASENHEILQVYNEAFKKGEIVGRTEKFAKETKLLDIGHECIENGQFDLAGERFNEALELNNSSEAALLGLSFCARQKKDSRKTVNYLSRLLEINPNHSEAYNQMGIVAFESNDLETAKTFLIIAIEKRPANIDAGRNLGEVLLAMGDYKNGIRIFVNILKMSPGDILTLISLSKLYIKNKRDDEALKLLNRVIEIDPENDEAKILMDNIRRQ